MRIEQIPIGNTPPNDVNVIIEVPVGGEPIKYELDKDSGTLFVDRFLYTPMRYPGNYGFIPHTLSEDGDPIDVLVCNTRVIVPAAVINCRPVGVLVMEDGAGLDERILAVPGAYRSAAATPTLRTTPSSPEITRRSNHFFDHYKDLERGRWVGIDHWGAAAEAKQMIVRCHQARHQHLRAATESGVSQPSHRCRLTRCAVRDSDDSVQVLGAAEPSIEASSRRTDATVDHDRCARDKRRVGPCQPERCAGDVGPLASLRERLQLAHHGLGISLVASMHQRREDDARADRIDPDRVRRPARSRWSRSG